MSDEPTYIFIRGTGWVPEVARRLLTRDRDGRNVWLIDRKPLKGDRYFSKSKHNTGRFSRFYDYANPNVPDLSKFDRILMRWQSFEQVKVRTRNTEYSENMFYVVVERAD
jgi:hypothetical protein